MWLANEWQLTTVLVPGQFAGYAAAHVARVVLVRRWERAHHERVLTAAEDLDDGRRLFAARLEPHTTGR
ncbi:MAG: hypothetical protein M3P39_08740 [Actinomycetota bacterium]|nr:hypothetical protein [Actinomycetota bacterium]